MSIKGLTLELNGNIAPLNKALADVNSTSRNLQGELREVERLLKLDPTNTELLAQKQKLLADSVENAKRKLDQLKLAQQQASEQLARGEIGEDQYRALQREVIKAEQNLEKLEKQAADTAADVDKLGKESSEAATQVNKVGTEAEEAAKKSSLLGDIFKGGFFANIATNALNATVSALQKLGAKAFEIAGSLIKLSDETGLSITRVQELNYVFTLLDGSTDLYAKSQARLTRAMSEARDGTAQYKDAFERLGWSVSDITNGDGSLRDATEVMGELIDQLGGIENPAERDAVALDLLGRSAQELNPLIKAGSEEIERLSQEAHSMGAVMSEEAIQALDTVGDRLEALGISVTNFVGEALAGLIEAFSKPTVNSLTQAAQAMDDVTEAADRNVARTAAAGAMALEYVDKLDALAEQGLDTAEAQEEYARTVDKLNYLVPELNLTINKQTGLINENTGAIRANVQAWLDAATAQALQEKFNATLEAYGAAQAEIIVNETEMQRQHLETIAIETQLETILRQVGESIGYTGKELEEFTSGMLAARVSNGDFGASLLASGVDASLLTNELYSLRRELIDSEAAEGVLNAAIEKGKSTLAEYEDEVNLANEAVSNLNKEAEGLAATMDAAAAREKVITGAFGAIETAADTLATAYENAKESAQKSIDSQVKLFGDLDTKAKVTIDSVIGSFEKQITYLDEYAENIRIAMEKGVDQGIIANLTDGSEESAKILAAIVQGGDEKIQELNEKFGKVEDGKEKFSSAVAEMETDFENSMNTIQEKLDETIAESDKYADMAEAGANSAQGYIDGINSKLDELRTTSAAFANALPKTTDATLKISSPSKVMEEKAGFAADGFIVGLRGKNKDVSDAGKDFAESMNKAIDAALSGATPDVSISSALSVPVQPVGAESFANVDEALSRMSSAIVGSMPSMGKGDLTIINTTNGVEFSRAILPDFRFVESQSPVEVKDY